MSVFQAAIGRWVQERGSGSDPFVVKLIEPPGDPTGIADVVVGSIGLTGALILIALVAAAVMAGGLYWFRSREAASTGSMDDIDQHRVTR
jgi:hypothetical protein